MPKSLRINDYLARAIVVTALLNLNGFAYMLLGVSQIFSILMLFCGLSIFILCRSFLVTAEVVVYFILMFGYALFGILFIPVFNDSQASLWEVQSLAATVMLTIAVVIHIQKLDNRNKRFSFYSFVRNVAVFAVTANLFSPLLYSIYANPPPSFEYRSAGLFANPNDAAYIGLFAAALTLLYPFQNRLFQVVILGLVSAGTMVTFSRGAIIILLLMLLLSLWDATRRVRLLVGPVMAIGLGLLVFNTHGIVDWISTQTLFDLGAQQQARLTSIALVLDGQIDTETSGARNELFSLAFNKAMSVFPLGTGLNTFKSIEGGISVIPGEWLGAHNSFLLVWGEAGVLMLLVMLALWAVVLLKSFRAGMGVQGLYLPLACIGCAMFSHELFSLRFMNVAVAFMLMQAITYRKILPHAGPHRNFRKLNWAR